MGYNSYIYHLGIYGNLILSKFGKFGILSKGSLSKPGIFS